MSNFILQSAAQKLLFNLTQKSFLLRCEFFTHTIPPISAPFLGAKKRWSLVRENQQSSAHNFVKDFSSIFPKSRRRSPLKKGAAAEIPLEYGKTEVQILFEPLQAAISSMELPKNFENKKLPNTLRRLAFSLTFFQRLGCRQAVRHRTLTPVCVGSNPAIPAT